jgi:hypothetical protein
LAACEIKAQSISTGWKIALAEVILIKYSDIFMLCNHLWRLVSNDSLMDRYAANQV